MGMSIWLLPFKWCLIWPGWAPGHSHANKLQLPSPTTTLGRWATCWSFYTSLGAVFQLLNTPQHVGLETWSPVQFLLHSSQSESRPPYFEIYSHLIKCLRTMTMEAHSSETSDANPSTRLDSSGREPLKDLRLLYSFGDGSVSHLLKLTPKFTIPIRIYSFCWLALSSWIPLKWKPW